MNSTILIESQYNPPVSTLYLLQKYENVIIDAYEHYEKKSYRNRCYICDSHGSFRLSVPLESGKSTHTPMNEVTIANDEDWAREHWRSIVSAYDRSPFFEFYKDELENIYAVDYTFLFQLNMQLLEFLIHATGINVQMRVSKKYIEEAGEGIIDFRSKIQPQKKKNKLTLNWHSYQQVFSDRMAFQKNLSSLDLLFNKGPQAGAYLQTLTVL